ncbi:hypothetical protein ACVME8_005483 [Bradyrhizobium diazoefficiens]
MSSRHSITPRGLNATRSSLSQGRFGRMFRKLAPAKFGPNDADNVANLSALADKMVADFDGPKDGPDAEESGIPALYTYFGQFIDHDITFDPVSSLTKQQDPDGLVDFRTPALDLDNLYGRGPNDQPYMYDGIKFRLGEKLTGAGVPDASDLPRFKGRALIGDPRNDENSIVSQFQALMLRFHNRMVDDNDSLSFEEVQQRVRFHYQYVVLNDFLPRIVKADVLNALKTAGQYDRSKLAHYHWKTYPFMPVEFSVAAYRLGHSMIRPGYRLNDAGNMLLQIFPDPHNPDTNALTGFRAMGPGRAMDWGRFIDLDTRALRRRGRRHQSRQQEATSVRLSHRCLAGGSAAQIAAGSRVQSVVAGAAQSRTQLAARPALGPGGRQGDEFDAADGRSDHHRQGRGRARRRRSTNRDRNHRERRVRRQLSALDLHPGRGAAVPSRRPDPRHGRPRHRQDATARSRRRPHRRRGLPGHDVRRQFLRAVAGPAMDAGDRLRLHAEGHRCLRTRPGRSAALSLRGR